MGLNSEAWVWLNLELQPETWAGRTSRTLKPEYTCISKGGAPPAGHNMITYQWSTSSVCLVKNWSIDWHNISDAHINKTSYIWEPWSMFRMNFCSSVPDVLSLLCWLWCYIFAFFFFCSAAVLSVSSSSAARRHIFPAGVTASRSSVWRNWRNNQDSAEVLKSQRWWLVKLTTNICTTVGCWHVLQMFMFSSGRTSWSSTQTRHNTHKNNHLYDLMIITQGAFWGRGLTDH